MNKYDYNFFENTEPLFHKEMQPHRNSTLQNVQSKKAACHLLH